MDIKLIVTDIDGTLVDNSEQIPEELVRLVEHCKEREIHFAVATGRTKELTDHIVRTLGITSPYVVANGACIFQEDQCIHSHGFSAYPIRDLIKKADSMGITVTLSNEYEEKALRLTDYVTYHQKMGGRFRSFLKLDEIDWQKDRFQKIMFMDEHRTGKIAGFQEATRDYQEYYWVTSYSDAAVELGPKECNKATGVKELADILKLDWKEVMACGDFYNDLEMIREAGVGVAVGNAHEEIKKNADYTSEASYAFGVIEAVTRYCF